MELRFTNNQDRLFALLIPTPLATEFSKAHFEDVATQEFYQRFARLQF